LYVYGAFFQTNASIMMNDPDNIPKKNLISLQYQALIEKAPDGVALIDADGKFKYISPSARKMFGYSATEEVLDNPAEFTHPDDLEMVLTALNKLMADPLYIPTLEYRYRNKQGNFRWVETTFSNLLANEAVESIILNFRDITERKQLEDVQNFLLTCGYPGANERFFDSLARFLSSTLDAEYVCIDRLIGDEPEANTIARFNDGKFDTNISYRLKHTPCGEVVGKTVCCFPENVCMLFPLDGYLREINAQSYIGATLWSSEGKPIGLIAAMGKNPMKNIPFAESVLKMVVIRASGELERIAVEEALRENELRYRQIFDNTFDIMAFYEVTEDHRFKVITYNAAEAKMLGPVEYYQNKYIDECIPPDLYNQFTKHYDRCIREEKLIIYEENINFQDIHKHFLTQLIPLKNDSGRVHRIIVISRDTTENMLLQTQLINQNEKLKSLNTDLIAAKEKAEESDRLKSAFLANMSHEIRTPMNGILGFAEILSDPSLTGEQQQEYLKIIQKSGVRMLNIINDIIDISKIESGVMNLNVMESNINEQMEYIYTFFKPEVESKKLEFSLRTTLPAKEAIIKTDREKLYAILTNIVKNAIKYTSAGTIEFGYNLTRANTLEFYVKDTGIGIPQNRQDAIFERFIQADISNKYALQGAGLGLAISKSFVKMMGGDIWVESEVGVGSTFYFTLPFQLKMDEEAKSKRSNTSIGEAPQTLKLNILIADDDETSEMLITITVKDFSKEVVKARNGAEAVELCRSRPDLDLILMDIQMPELNGYEATRQIRKFNKDIVIIAQTAYGLSSDREKALEAGCTDYIAKPINKKALLSLIQKYIQK